MKKSILSVWCICIFITIQGASQDFMTKSEYEFALSQHSELDTIEGLYKLNPFITKIEDEDVFIELEEQSGFYFIVNSPGLPDSVFVILSAESTNLTTNHSLVNRTREGDYIFYQVFDNDGYVSASFTWVSPEVHQLNQANTLWHTQFEQPFISTNKDQNFKQKTEVAYYWLAQDLTALEKEDSTLQESVYQAIYDTYYNKERSTQELEEIEATANDSFVSHFRNLLDTKEIWAYPGAYHFPKDIANDQFQVITVSDIGTSIVSYLLMFKNHDQVIYEVLFYRNQEREVVRLKAINPSLLFLPKTISLIKEMDGKKTTFWR